MIVTADPVDAGRLAEDMVARGYRGGMSIETISLLGEVRDPLR